MKRLSLIAQNAEGNISHQRLPAVTTQTIFDVQTAQLAVIFDIKNSPEKIVYPHFLIKNVDELSVLRQDFLWENHCFELFLAFGKAENSPYLEINFSPKGEFNLYQFDRYRTPQQMPPRRLQVAENQWQALLNFYRVNGDNSPVFWQDSLPVQQTLRDSVQENFLLESDSHWLVMMINVEILAKLLKLKKMDKLWLNPCAVFKGKKETVYFAHQHASPPDFHDKQYWSEIKNVG